MIDAAAPAATESNGAHPRLARFAETMRKVEALLRNESKETLLLFLAAEIVRKAEYSFAVGDVPLDATIERELEALGKWRDTARSNNIFKRLDSKLARIRNGEFGKRRRRRRNARKGK